MKSYMFDIEDAERLGVDEAILLYNIRFWCDKNKANGTHKHEDNYWTYNSSSAFSKLFPFWSPRQVGRIIKNLEKQGAINVGNFNKSAYDRTRWFSVNAPTELSSSISPNSQMEEHEKSNGATETVTPIPDSKQQIVNADSKQQIVNADSKQQIVNADTDKLTSFNVFYSLYPKKTGRKRAEIKWGKLTDKDRANAINGVSRFIANKDLQYISAPLTYLNGELWNDETQLPPQKYQTKDFDKTDYSEIPEGFE